MLPIVGGVERFVGVSITPDEVRRAAWKNLPTILRGLAVRRRRTSGGQMMAKPFIVRVGWDGSCPCIVHAWEKSRTQCGSVQDFVGGFAPHAGGQGVTNMLSNPDPAAKGFRGIGGKAGVIDLVTDGFQPGELKKGADVSDTSSRQE